MEVEDLPPTYDDLYDNNIKEAEDDNLPCYEVAIEIEARQKDTDDVTNFKDNILLCEEKTFDETTCENKTEEDKGKYEEEEVHIDSTL